MVACQFNRNNSSEDFIRAVAKFDFSYQHPMDNIWYIQSNHTIDNIQQTLLSLIELDDILIINDVSDQRDYNADLSIDSHEGFRASENNRHSFYA